MTIFITLASLPEYSHQNHERKFFRFLLSVDRLSGTEDLLPVLAAEDVLAQADLFAGERFTISLLPTRWEDVSGVELAIEKVWFDDATIWRRGTASLTEYESNALPAGRRLDQLRFVAGPDAVGYPEWQRRVWVCVCGRANDLHNDR